MEYVYAAMLLHASGKPINEETITRVLRGAEIKPDQARVKALVSSLAGVDIDKLIREASLPAGPPAEAKPEKAEKSEKPEKKEEKKEAAEGLGALFGT